ncbi:MAG: carbamoyltransferase C-terminal domain-containing protein [Synechococcaceae cyanobacterium]|nr:carbamoyltransferase C-terminal domain-containing protein [Synechococcaceae cyanobacterium]
MTLILGINAFHADAAAALVRDGRILSAAEEERFRRIKHWAGFPSEAIAWCLADAGVRLADVDHVAINSLPSAHRLRKIAYTLRNRPDPRFLLQRWRNKRERADLASQLAAAFPDQEIRAQLHFVEHHRAHLASAFYASPYEQAAVVSVDGFGDFASGAWGYGEGTDLTLTDQIWFPHSLGAFYTAITQYLGFPNYGDEYKVMGLAPYGTPSAIEAMRQIVRLQPDGTYRLDLRYFRHATERLPHQWSHGTPVVGVHWTPVLEELLGPARRSDEPLEQRHHDIARSAQAMYEEAFFHLLRAVHAARPVDQICIAGGCGANSVANGKVTLATPFREVFVQAAAGDAGGALGAALDVWHQLGGARSTPMANAYLGSRPAAGEVAALLADPATRAALEEAHCSVETPADDVLCRQVAESISEGLVIGWFEGRMEWGPRALGHRSILGDPRRADMKDILNLKIKRRESFRPFAPSVLREAVPEWFELDGEVPFMMQVYPIRAEKRSLIPAVTHVDGSGRLQTVNEAANGRYYRLIRAFAERTGVPMLLNTSFNENEPIVCSPAQALDCFLRTRMDVLVLEDTVIRRHG